MSQYSSHVWSVTFGIHTPIQRPPGFKSQAHADDFCAAALEHRRGSLLASICRARNGTRTVCTQVPLEFGSRCLRHAGPDATRAHRERQVAGLRTGRLSPEAFARVEARRARTALDWSWRKMPKKRVGRWKPQGFSRQPKSH